MNERLIKARQKAGCTQGEVAGRIGVDRSTFAHYERGRMPTLDTAIKIARVLGLSVEDIFDHHALQKQHCRSVAES